MTIFYITCVRFYNTTIPVVLHAPEQGSGTVTLIQYDSSCNPVAPLSINKRSLVPPDEWVTNWKCNTKKPIAIAQSIISESDNQVITRFPRRHIVEQGQSSTSLLVPTLSQVQSAYSKEPMVMIDPDILAKLKALLTEPMISPTASVQYVNPPLATICEHPHCSKNHCQFSSDPPQPHGSSSEQSRIINMIKFVPSSESSEQTYRQVTFFNVHEDLLIQSVSPTTSRGLGFVDPTAIPAYRRNPIDKIPESVEIPSDSEIIAFLKIFKGIGPYDPEDPWKKKMFNLDIYTHEK